MPDPIKIFCSYASEDGSFFQQLRKHLRVLTRQEHIVLWQRRRITPGTNWAQAIDTQVNCASVILLLISANFLDSDYCYGVEMKRALERQSVNEAYVIPILIRPVDWEKAPFKHLEVLPTDAKPITLWRNQDEAFKNVVQGISVVLEEVRGLPLENLPTFGQFVNTGPGPIQHIEIGDHSIAEDNQMRNGARHGSQTVYGGDTTTVKGNIFEIS